ncbi:DUF2793 domain-containing protein [Stappia indica]|uniref:DUF2793 domain-containing protein n=1 Tax=Stappia indica TaxID=538381 RepID=UPI001CD344D6|nr:DUF2793 domain-containing protein [Stappia indica]MCA1300785.1 DUF2793 domain-containing protein [Stappia indica]
MGDMTTRLAFPLMSAAQAQKHVTHNEALLVADALVHLAVASRATAVPPAAPDPGQRFIVAGGATDVFSEKEGEVAEWRDGAWIFHAPAPGWRAWVINEGGVVVFTDGGWVDLRSLPKTGTDMLGINASPTTGERFVVCSESVLLTHDGADQRLKLNKAAATDTASLLFQTGYSGRAEVGIAGDDHFRIKISADGAVFRSAVDINPANGDFTYTLANGGSIEFARYSVGGSPRLLLNADMVNGARSYVSFRHANVETAALYSSYSETTATADFYVRAVEDDTNIAFVTRHAGVTQWAHLKLDAATGFTGIGTHTPSTKLDVYGPVRVKGYTVAGLPSAVEHGAGAIVFVSDESGGPVLAFSDGAGWRRVNDRAVVS